MADFVGDLRPITTARTLWDEPRHSVWVPNPQRSYVQRVYSSGLSQWCYYTKNAIDSAPLSTDTTPNWTGSITVHQVLVVI